MMDRSTISGMVFSGEIMNEPEGTFFDAGAAAPLEPAAAPDITDEPAVSEAPPAPPTPPRLALERSREAWTRISHDVVVGLQTLVSAAVYATLIVTFGFQVARVDGLSM